MSSDKIIKEIKRNKNLIGECDRCGGTFPLSKAFIFDARDPIPEKVKEWIEVKKTNIKKGHEELANRKLELKRAKKQITNIPKITTAVNVGKIIEKLVPAYKGIKFEEGDFRSLYEPIDYIVFNGITIRNRVDSIHFVEIKTGNAYLNYSQQAIKNAIEREKLLWRYF